MRSGCCEGQVITGVVNDFYSFSAPGGANLQGTEGIALKIMAYAAWRAFCFVLG